MRIVVIGTEAMAHKLSARYGTPFFLVGEDMDAVRLEGLCAASNWIAVAQTAPEQPMLLERADAVMICMEAQAARAMRKLFGRPQRTPELSPEQIAALRQACPGTVLIYGERAALRYPESAGLAQSADFI